MLQPGRKYNGGYRYGFNGKEEDDEVKGDGNYLDFENRVYDSRLGRWLSIDPLMKKYPSQSPYNFSVNNPVRFIDIDGRDVGVKIDGNTITFSNTFYIQGGDALLLANIQKQYNEKYKGKLGGTYTDANGKTYNVKFEMSFKLATSKDVQRIRNSKVPLAESLVTINPNSQATYSSGIIGGNSIDMSNRAAYMISFYLHEGSHNMGMVDRYDNMALVDEKGFRAKLSEEFKWLDGQSITLPGFEGDPLGGNFKLDESGNLVEDNPTNYSQEVIDQFSRKALEYSKENGSTSTFVLEGNLDTDANKNKGGLNKNRKIPASSANQYMEKNKNR